MNEEDVRGKILLPFLSNLGFGESEVFLENSFTIRLGKSRIKTGRSDILCKRHGQNLFVIELKKDSKSIDQNDIEQGISYARLLQDNIAPFTIITNGKDTKIFDTISREDLTGSKISEKSSFWKDGCTISTDFDLKIRYEALKNFISFSPANLKLFCKNQVQDRMGTIIGNIENPYSKFIKELHVQRQDLQSEFTKFITSNTSVFGLIGDAGVGKTSAICSLTLQQLEAGIVFFYNAALINKSPLEHIAQDLNLAFSSRAESDVILKKLDELGRFLNQDVTIFIDAIDEHTGSNLALELSEIALIVRNLERIKICISCKSNIWDSVLRKNSNPTHLFEELHKFHPPISKLNNCPGFLLENFTNEELDSIIPLYQKTFGFKGQISDSILKELRNGFFLRIFSEVYSQREIPQEIDDKKLIKKYLKQSLDKTHLGFEVGARILSKIGQVITNHKYSSWEAFRDEGLDIESLVEKLDFQTDETIPEDLFTRNILIKSSIEDSYNVSFYYSKIRDYVICFHSYKLDKLSDDEFYDSLELFYENHIGQSAITFYVRNAPPSHKAALVKFIKDKSHQYANDYNSYLEHHFKRLKTKFDPKTDGNIGIFLPEDLFFGHGYALFPLGSNSQNIVQFENLSLNSNHQDLFFHKGVQSIHGSFYPLLIRDQAKSIQENIFKQLKEIIKKGRISVYNSDILLLEQVSTILYYYHQKLGYSFSISDFYLPRFDLIYPIDLNELKYRLYKFRAIEHYKRENYRSKPRLDSTAIEVMANRAVEEQIEIPPLNVHGDFPPFEELNKIVDILLGKGYSVLSEHHLPCPDISIADTKELQEKNRKFELSKIRPSQFSEAQARLYVETFIRHFDTSYSKFIEYAFPTFKEQFHFYTTSPHEYFIYMKDEDILKWGVIGYRKSTDKKVKIHYKQYTSSNEPFEKGETKVLIGFSLDQILHNGYYDVIKTVDHINTPKVDDFCVLRNWIYKFLKNDTKELFKENNV
ncbi:Type I restriction enzyme R protein N terminus (HSDR_N) [Ekhidna lutea]|uniref:Type I restriction enzyme R protein N terminus (HSDR_N) n=1 Tax=Ekhidna lutea TaxID=447679 RepID=A0A239MAH6_EKHLU|nr:type I restriction enzyme HsdR N-terminal domain-containing protein [Ekhidna lutea]SNT39746.1 Type I restriction enzyme R protein N terminus (HSDR_N) [Ekhidna lutea]